MHVIYIDSVFALNTLLDYLLLLCTARLAGIPLKRVRYCLGALLGGSYAAAACCLPSVEFLAAVPIKIAVGILMALTAFSCEPYLFRLMALFLGISCGLAGGVVAAGILTGKWISHANGVLFVNGGMGEVLTVATLGYLFFTVVFRAAAKHCIRREFVPVTVGLGERCISLNALADSGCTVADPVSGQPVLVISAKHLIGLFPHVLRPFLQEERLCRPTELLEALRNAAPEVSFFLVPYRTVGTAGGLLLAFRSDWTQVGADTYRKLPVGLAPGEIGEGYQALWGGTVGKDGVNDRLARENPVAAD